MERQQQNQTTQAFTLSIFSAFCSRHRPIRKKREEQHVRGMELEHPQYNLLCVLCLLSFQYAIDPFCFQEESFLCIKLIGSSYVYIALFWPCCESTSYAKKKEEVLQTILFFLRLKTAWVLVRARHYDLFLYIMENTPQNRQDHFFVNGRERKREYYAKIPSKHFDNKVYSSLLIS